MKNEYVSPVVDTVEMSAENMFAASDGGSSTEAMNKNNWGGSWN